MNQNRFRQLVIAFWVIIGVLGLWQFYDYNQSITQANIDHPAQTKFIFLHTNAPAAAPSMAHSDNAEVVQTGFDVQQDQPTQGSFTCQVTIKNVGHATATEIQVCVRPYRGTSNYDEDAGHQTVYKVDDQDPISLFNDWLSFPDLAPGESSTRPVVFMSRNDARPGVNPTPQIIFNSVKPKPGAPVSTPAPAPDAAPAPPPQTPVHHGGASD